MNKVVAAVLAALMLLVAPAADTLEARDFGFGGAFKKLYKAPGKILRDGSVHSFRRALGVVAVATVGVSVLGALSASERRDITRRTARVVRTDPDREVVDTYTVSKGKKRVTIIASPVQKKDAFKDDPALRNAGAKQDVASADDQGPPGSGMPGGKLLSGGEVATGKTDPPSTDPPVAKDDPPPGGNAGPDLADGGDTKKDGKSDATDGKDASKDKGKDEDDGRIAYDDVPVDTDCRRMTIEVADASTASGTKTDAPPAGTTSASIVCRLTGDDWKPVKP